MNLTANEIAQKVNGSILGDGETKLTGFAKADAASTGDLTFAENEKFFRLAEQSEASAILAPAEFQSESKTVIQVKDARIAFAQVHLTFLSRETIYSRSSPKRGSRRLGQHRRDCPHWP